MAVARSDRDDLHARSRALRTFLDEHWGASGVPAPQLAEPTTDEEREHQVFVAPAGDLTGDGAEDVFVSSFTVPDGAHLVQALRGSDGEELWRVESNWEDGLAWPAGADLTGDGNDDLLVWEWMSVDWSSGDDCLPVYPLLSCSQWEELAFRAVVGVRSGADGSLAWSHTYEGTERWEMEYGGDPVSYSDVERVTTSNLLVLPWLSGDHDADGGRDLLLNVVDMRWEQRRSGTDLIVMGSEEGTDQMRFDTRAFLASGASGDVRMLREVEDAPYVGTLEPADEQGSTMLWTTWHYDDWSWTCEHTLVDGGCSFTDSELTGTIQLLDGVTLTPRWSVPISRDDWAFSLAEDLTGDGLPEVFVDHWSFDWDGNLTARGTILAGADGTVLWDRDQFWQPLVVPALDGADRRDVLVLSVRDRNDTVILRAERAHGATGEALLVTEHEFARGDESEVWASAWPVGDVSGDGRPDLAWQVHRIWSGQPCEDADASACWFFQARAATTLLLEATSTGVTHWTVDLPGYASLTEGGDLDGSGTAEVLLAHAADGPLHWSALDAATGQPLWRESYTDFTRLLPARDQTGDGADDLLRLGEPVWRRTSGLVAGITGSTGEQRWISRYE